MDTKIFTKDNKYLMLAFDHRGSFKKFVDPVNYDSLTNDQLIKVKEKIIAPVSGLYSSILLDPAIGLLAYKNVIAKKENSAPYLLCSEASGYEDVVGERKTLIKYSAAELKDLGAQGVKILLYFHPQANNVEEQLATAQKAIEDSHNNGLPIFVEFLTYSLAGKKSTKKDLVLESIKRFKNAGAVPDVWKLEYPDDAEACQAVTELVNPVPWILLTRGVTYEEFKKQLQTAVSSGAVGFLAGRALWQEYFQLADQAKEDFLLKTYPDRFKEISAIVLRG
jgi:tagatose-1,6-bisphosphate aldolase